MGRSGRRLGRRVTDTRLDPVRWGRPSRGTLIRFTVVIALLAAAWITMWSRPRGCGPPPAASASPASSADALTSPPAERGRTAGPQRSGTPVPPGTVGVPVRLAEPAALNLVHPGDRVDLLRVGAADGGTTSVASAALVLGVTDAGDPATAGLLLALPPAEARKAVATPERGFAILVRPG
jgi:hypothetical protein